MVFFFFILIGIDFFVSIDVLMVEVFEMIILLVVIFFFGCIMNLLLGFRFVVGICILMLLCSMVMFFVLSFRSVCSVVLVCCFECFLK